MTESNSQKKPARVQVDPKEYEEEELPPQTGTVFNIWFNKWSGGGNSFQLIKAKHKLNVEKDTGYTKADKLASKGSQQYFCLFFAKGMCSKGRKCEYLHRIPTDYDIFPQTVDCFGREKFSEYRDDMSGIGSFNHVNKTLYLGGLVIRSDIQDVLNREFRQFGKIVKINVIHDKNCGFVTFKNEQNAQFAKEATIGQSVYGTDILNVKWANEDPNPTAIKEKKRQFELETQQVVKNLLEKFNNGNKRAKIEDGTNEPVIEEPQEDESDAVVDEIKQIEEAKPANQTILDTSNLSILKLLNRAPSTKPLASQPLVSGYESDDDDD